MRSSLLENPELLRGIREPPERITDYDEHGGGFLTQASFEYLRDGEEGLSKSQVRNRKSMVRNGLQNAIVDFRYLKSLDEKDRHMTFAPLYAALNLKPNEEAVEELLDPHDKGDIQPKDAELGVEMLEGLRVFNQLLAERVGAKWYARLLAMGMLSRVGEYYDDATARDQGPASSLSVTVTVEKDGETLIEETV